MVKRFQKSDIEDLLTKRCDPCISIYLPTHQQGMETKEDPIRFKNLLRDCEKRLQRCGLSRPATQELLRPAAELLDPPHIWQHLERGLVVFIAPDIFRALTLPIECPVQAWIGAHFHIKPLVPLWGPEQRFCILALSRGQARLYEADRWTIRPVDLSDTPKDLNQFLRYDETQESLQYHTMPTGKITGTAAMFHGQGNAADKAAQKSRVDEYVKAVRNGVENYLAADNRPLILVAPEYVQSAYRTVSRYNHLLEDGLQQVPDHLSDNELHEAVRALAQPSFTQVVHDRLARYRNLLGTGYATDQIEQIIPTAKEGRIQTLLLDPTVSLGDEANVAGERGDEPLDLAVRCTLAQGGEAYAVDRRQIPSESAIGAIFRY